MKQRFWQVTDKQLNLIHVVLNIQYTEVTIFGASKVYGIAANFTVNGVNTPESYNYLVTSSGTFDATSWDSTGSLNVFPSMDITTLASSAKAGNVLYLAMYNEVVRLTQIFLYKLITHHKIPHLRPYPCHSSSKNLQRGYPIQYQWCKTFQYAAWQFTLFALKY